MIYLKDTGFVIKRVNLGESDRYLTLFTQDHGKIEVLAKGVRRINSRRAPHIELLNLIRFQTTKTKRNHILTEVEVVNTFSNIRNEMKHIGKMFLICELINSLCASEQKNFEVFSLVEATLNNFNRDDRDEEMLDFQTKMLASLGFWDSRDKFRSNEELSIFIERIIEKKIKTTSFFKF